MYTMTIDKKPFFDPRMDEYALERPTLTQEANKLSTLTFTIYPNHPEYANINKRRSIINIYQDEALIMRLYALKSKLNTKGGIEYKCAELASILNDIRKRPGGFRGTPAGYLNHVLDDFNDRYEGAQPVAPQRYLDIDVPLYRGIAGHIGDIKRLQTNLVMLGYNLPQYGIDGKYGDETAYAVKKFRTRNGLSGDYVFDQDALDVMTAIMYPDAGTGSGGSASSNSDIMEVGDVEGIETSTATFINEDYVGYWDLLQEKLVGTYGGYLISRYTEDKIIIDYKTDDYLSESSQRIRFGENLTSIFIDTDTSDTFSVLIPLGADVKRQKSFDEQADYTPLTIASVNNGRDYLENADGLVLYGRREVTYRWEDEKDAGNLKTLGQTFLDVHAVRLAENVTLTAVDLRDTGADIEAMNFMERVQVESDAHGIGDTYTLSRKTTPLGIPKNSKIQMGVIRESLTDRISDNAARAAQAYAFLNGRVFNVENPEPESEPEETEP